MFTKWKKDNVSVPFVLRSVLLATLICTCLQGSLAQKANFRPYHIQNIFDTFFNGPPPPKSARLPTNQRSPRVVNPGGGQNGGQSTGPGQKKAPNPAQGKPSKNLAPIGPANQPTKKQLTAANKDKRPNRKVQQGPRSKSTKPSKRPGRETTKSSKQPNGPPTKPGRLLGSPPGGPPNNKSPPGISPNKLQKKQLLPPPPPRPPGLLGPGRLPPKPNKNPGRRPQGPPPRKPPLPPNHRPRQVNNGFGIPPPRIILRPNLQHPHAHHPHHNNQKPHFNGGHQQHHGVHKHHGHINNQRHPPPPPPPPGFKASQPQPQNNPQLNNQGKPNPQVPGGLDLIPAPLSNTDSSTKITIIDELNKDVPVLEDNSSPPGPVFTFPPSGSDTVVLSGNTDSRSLSPSVNDFVPSTPVVIKSPVTTSPPLNLQPDNPFIAPSVELPNLSGNGVEESTHTESPVSSNTLSPSFKVQPRGHSRPVINRISLSDFQAALDRLDSVNPSDDEDEDEDSFASGSSVDHTVIKHLSPSERLFPDTSADSTADHKEEEKDEFYFVRANAEQLPQPLPLLQARSKEPRSLHFGSHSKEAFAGSESSHHYSILGDNKLSTGSHHKSADHATADRRVDEVTELVDCGGSDLGFCDMSSKYPGHMMGHLMSECQELVYQGFVPIPDDLEELGDLNPKTKYSNASKSSVRASQGSWSWKPYEYEQKPVCDSENRFIRPGYARDTSGVWRVIVQTPDLPQRVAIDLCRSPNKPCHLMSDCGRKSRCIQRYNYQHLLAVDPSNMQHCPTIRAFKFPSACVCHIDQPKHNFF